MPKAGKKTQKQIRRAIYKDGAKPKGKAANGKDRIRERREFGK